MMKRIAKVLSDIEKIIFDEDCKSQSLSDEECKNILIYYNSVIIEDKLNKGISLCQES